MDDDDFEMFSPEEFLAALGAPRQSFRRARPMDAVVLGMGLLHGVCEAVTSTVMDAYNIAAGHANFYVQQDQFQQDAAREIETIIAGDEE